MYRLMLLKVIIVNEFWNDGLIFLFIIKENEIKFYFFYRLLNVVFLV